MSKALFRKMVLPQGPVLIPCDEDGRELLDSLKSMKDVMADIHSPRNPKHHRMLFLLMRKATDAGAWEGDEESLLDWLKYATGHVRTVVDHNGHVHYAPKSIAFESMDQASFLRFFDRAVFVICHRLLGSDDWQGVRDEIIEVVDGRFEAQRRAA